MNFEKARQEFGHQPHVLGLLTAIENCMGQVNRPILVAFDGRSGAGKSTLALRLAELLGAGVVHTDDFWAGGDNAVWDARTAQERIELAIDWMRLRAEVLVPLRQGMVASWRPFDFVRGEGLVETELSCQPKQVIFIDGAYSARPELHDVLDLKILVEVSTDPVRRGRLISREGEFYMHDWHSRWDSAEDHYFSRVMPSEAFDVVIDTNELGAS